MNKLILVIKYQEHLHFIKIHIIHIIKDVISITN